MDVPEAWLVALDLAWESMLAGTTPVGSVVIDGSGGIVATGRGRRYVQGSVAGELSYSHLAHAELNALAQLPPTDRLRGPYGAHDPRAVRSVYGSCGHGDSWKGRVCGT